MRGWAAVAALLVLGAFIVPPVGPQPSVSFPNPPNVYVTTSSSFGEAGDNVTVDVYTYTGVNLTDADSIPLVQALWGVGTLPVEGPARIGTGHYRGFLVLPWNSPPGVMNGSFVTLDATATIGGVQIAGYGYVDWITPGPFLRFFSNVRTIGPTQRMHLRAELYNDTTPVDADPGSVWFYPLTFLGPGAAFAPNRTAVGVYEADFTLHLGNGTIGVGANATYHGVRLTRSLSPFSGWDSATIPELNLPTYQAWYHTLSSNQTRVHGELWVADAWGRPAPGVPVSLVWNWNQSVTFTGTTGASGAFPLDVPLMGGYAAVSGSVGGSSLRAIPVIGSFPTLPCDASPFPGIYERATPLDPAILPDGSLRDYLQPGMTVLRSYHVTNPFSANLAPLANTTMIYYLLGASSGAVYGTGHGVTDAGGNLSLRFTAPSEGVSLSFYFTGLASPSGASYTVASPLMGLRVSTLRLGGPTDVQASFGGRGTVYANSGHLVALGSVQILESSSGPWDDWSDATRCPYSFLAGTVGGINATFHLPSFLPSSGRYLVQVWARGGSVTTEQYALLFPGQSTDIPVGGPGISGPALLQILYWVTLGAVVAAIAVVGALWLLRRRRPAPPPPPPP